MIPFGTTTGYYLLEIPKKDYSDCVATTKVPSAQHFELQIQLGQTDQVDC